MPLLLQLQYAHSLQSMPSTRGEDENKRTKTKKEKNAKINW